MDTFKYESGQGVLLCAGTFRKIGNSYSGGFAGIPVGFAVASANRVVQRVTGCTIVRFFYTFTFDVFLTTQ